MIRVRYIGNKSHLRDRTALARRTRKGFVVQVDDLRHRFAHGWWRQDPKLWEPINKRE